MAMESEEKGPKQENPTKNNEGQGKYATTYRIRTTGNYPLY